MGKSGSWFLFNLSTLLIFKQSSYKALQPVLVRGFLMGLALWSMTLGLHIQLSAKAWCWEMAYVTENNPKKSLFSIGVPTSPVPNVPLYFAYFLRLTFLLLVSRVLLQRPTHRKELWGLLWAPGIVSPQRGNCLTKRERRGCPWRTRGTQWLFPTTERQTQLHPKKKSTKRSKVRLLCVTSHFDRNKSTTETERDTFLCGYFNGCL